MHIDPSLANADQPDPEQGFAWLPAQARRQFAHRSDRQSRTVAQYVYSIALPVPRSEEHTSELQSLMRISYAVFCLKKKKTTNDKHDIQISTTHNDHNNRHLDV